MHNEEELLRKNLDRVFGLLTHRFAISDSMSSPNVPSFEAPIHATILMVIRGSGLPKQVSLRIFQLSHIVLHSYQSVQCVCVCVHL